jgi:hypothetical protein
MAINTHTIASDLMGKVGVVRATLEKHKDGGKLSWERKEREIPRAGWVVGLRWAPSGVVEKDYGGGGLYEPDHLMYRYLKETSPRQPYLLVAYWPTEKPVRVPLDGYFPEVPEYQPYPASGYGEEGVREKYLEEASKYAKEQKRDERGRFLKGG